MINVDLPDCPNQDGREGSLSLFRIWPNGSHFYAFTSDYCRFSRMGILFFLGFKRVIIACVTRHIIVVGIIILLLFLMRPNWAGSNFRELTKKKKKKTREKRKMPHLSLRHMCYLIFSFLLLSRVPRVTQPRFVGWIVALNILRFIILILRTI